MITQIAIVVSCIVSGALLGFAWGRCVEAKQSLESLHRMYAAYKDSLNNLEKAHEEHIARLSSSQSMRPDNQSAQVEHSHNVGKRRDTDNGCADA